MPSDPVRRVLLGCAVVAAVVVMVLVAVAFLVGWRLTRDETPGRAMEYFLVGDETAYWRVDLNEEDAGLRAFFARLDEINDATRRDLVRGTFLESIPLPRRRAKLDELAPFTLEVSRSGDGWAARGTFSHGVLRLRLALKVVRFLLTRDAGKGDNLVVDGVTVTRFHDENASFSLAGVGNRVLVAGDADRMRLALKSSETTEADEGLASLFELHRIAALPGEDAWALLSHPRIGDWSRPPAIAGAAASFDLNERDELAFRMAISGEATAVEGSAFLGTRDQCLALVVAFLPGFPLDDVELDTEGARRFERGELECSGRIRDVSRRVSRLLTKVTARRQETPSASPNPPSLPPPSGPRSETPAGPPHEGTPTPPR